MKSAKASSFTEARLFPGLDPVHALAHGLYQAAKQDGGRRFHSLYDKVSVGTCCGGRGYRWLRMAAPRGLMASRLVT